jgi:hypothetical protein
MNVRIEIAGKRSQLVVSADLVFRALAIAQNRLRGLLIVPEIRLSDAGFERLQMLAVRLSVKDNSEP